MRYVSALRAYKKQTKEGKRLKQGTFVVSGGASFIGSHLVDRLLKEGYDVTVIDNLLTGKLENIKHDFGVESFRFVDCDIRNPVSSGV